MKWFESSVQPFLKQHAPTRLPPLASDYERLKRLSDAPDRVVVCFLGNSGIGKSTLLNAVAAGAEHVLPAGGIGPLTAQATEVLFSPTPYFRVTYHQRKHLWKVAFALERRLENERRQSQRADVGASELAVFLDEEDQNDAAEVAEVAAPAADAPEGGTANTEAIDQITKQAKLIITGNQFADVDLAYLVDALRVACDVKPRWNQEPRPDDAPRIARVRELMRAEKTERTHHREQRGDPSSFMAELREHAAGFLAPLIEHIQVGWPSEVLKSGVELVDLPGVGIASDAYREITKRYVRQKARAIILVVDRAGPTESTIDVLRSSGYWDRLVGATDDPSSDPCSLIIAVTRVDDVATTRWQEWDSNLGLRPKKREMFAKAIEEFKPRMHTQVAEQLSKIGGSENEAVQAAREQAKATILSGLRVFPVSAPEFAKLLRDDEEDQAFLRDISDTGIPDLQRTLVDLGRAERRRRANQVQEVSGRLLSSALNELQIVRQQWQGEGRAAEEAQRLEAALELILGPKKQEYGRRVGAFREFLESTVQAKIDALVLEAKEEAEREVRAYLFSLRGAHWATLRAAVRRGGAFSGSRYINLPDDISNYFQEPMAAVWSQKLLRDVRKRTGELSEDISQMVEEICRWAKEHGGASVNRKMLDAQQERVAEVSAQMKQVGKEAVDELRSVVKSKLSAAIQNPIKRACEKFVEEGNDCGAGVKSRILNLFEVLAHQATHSAQRPAIAILQSNFSAVRAEIQTAFSEGGDPIQTTADLIVQKHEERVRRSDLKRRSQVLTELDTVLGSVPGGAIVASAAA